MDSVTAGRLERNALLAQSGEVGREDGWADFDVAVHERDPTRADRGHRFQTSGGSVPFGSVELRVTATARDGAGVARGDDGRVVFVEGALPGESVTAEIVRSDRRWARARVVQIIESSPDRVPVSCAHQLEGCGGCDFLHVAPPARITMKTAMAVDQLARAGVDGPDPAMRTLEDDHGRTTVRAAVHNSRAAYRRRSSHDVVVPDSCAAVDPCAESLLIEGRYPGSSTVVIRVGNRTGDRLVVVDGPTFEVEVPDDVRVVSRRELSEGKRAWIHEVVAGHRLRISANSFFQNRPAGADALVDEVASMITDAPDGPLIDAYSGVGLFSRALHGDRAVTAIERSRDSIADARVNLAGVDARIIRSGVERWRASNAAVVIADPAREGLGSRGVGALLAAEPDVFILVSCDPSAFGRDAARLVEGGYELDCWTVLDLFPGTSHVETVARFTR